MRQDFFLLASLLATGTMAYPKRPIWISEDAIPNNNRLGSSNEASSILPRSAASDYQHQVIAHHNVHRANHSAADIAWDDGLASTAQKIAASCKYAHNTQVDGGGYGQNIQAGTKPADVNQVISNSFYNGEVNYFAGLYGQANPDMSNFEHWGHFSQVVWKNTKRVGCYTMDCSAKGLSGVGSNVSPYFTVCNYSPPGNYGGQYAQNIGRPLGRPTVQGTQKL